MCAGVRIGLTAVVTVLLSLQCSMQLAGPGNSSETGNTVRISAAALAISGHAPQGTRVELYSSDYVPIAQFHSGVSSSLVVDSSGKFSFGQLAEGYYNLLLRDSAADLSGLFVESVPLFADSTFGRSYDSLALSGSIVGTALRENAADSVLSWTYVFIAGSPFYDYTADDGQFALSGLPPHRYTLCFFGVDGQLVTSAGELEEEADTVTVVAGATTQYRN
jgi:hypothetical protein